MKHWSIQIFRSFSCGLFLFSISRVINGNVLMMSVLRYSGIQNDTTKHWDVSISPAAVLYLLKTNR